MKLKLLSFGLGESLLGKFFFVHFESFAYFVKKILENIYFISVVHSRSLERSQLTTGGQNNPKLEVIKESFEIMVQD